MQPPAGAYYNASLASGCREHARARHARLQAAGRRPRARPGTPDPAGDSEAKRSVRRTIRTPRSLHSKLGASLGGGPPPRSVAGFTARDERATITIKAAARADVASLLRSLTRPAARHNGRASREAATLVGTGRRRWSVAAPRCRCLALLHPAARGRLLCWRGDDQRQRGASRSWASQCCSSASLNSTSWFHQSRCR